MNIRKTSEFKAYTCQIGMFARELGALPMKWTISIKKIMGFGRKWSETT
ncbi:hypothetical protein [Peribacillus muralis]